jgi:hypothetical protein
MEDPAGTAGAGATRHQGGPRLHPSSCRSSNRLKNFKSFKRSTCIQFHIDHRSPLGGRYGYEMPVVDLGQFDHLWVNDMNLPNRLLTRLRDTLILPRGTRDTLIHPSPWPTTPPWQRRSEIREKPCSAPRVPPGDPPPETLPVR